MSSRSVDMPTLGEGMAPNFSDGRLTCAAAGTRLGHPADPPQELFDRGDQMRRAIADRAPEDQRRLGRAKALRYL